MAPETRAAALVARGITKAFDGQPALAGVDLTVRVGEIHGLLGENGAGKSTLMNVLAGVVRPDTGTITVDGHALRPGSPSDSAALGIGMVHQHFSLIPALTVAENLSLAARDGPIFFRRSDRLAPLGLARAEQLGWRFEPSTPVWQLSIGRQQRLEIVKALQDDARWLLFDEPTAVLSPPEVEELFQVLEQLRREGRAILFISHKLAEVRRLCDRITVLRRGRRVGELPRGATAEALAGLMIGTTSLRPGADQETNRDRARASAEDRPFLGTGSREAAMAGGPALVVSDLRVRGDRGFEAIRGLSFEVRRGEIFGIGGVDGNGQTELAEAVMSLRPAAAGQITLTAGGPSASPVPTAQALDGRRSHSRRRRPPPRPGYIPQDRRRAGLVLEMSTRENLALEIHAAPEFRWGPVMRLARLWAATAAMGRRFDVRVVDDRLPAAALSGGNQQKIVIARALTSERTLLVAVNPTRGLDLAATRYVHEQLKAARSAGVGVLLISTELDEVLALSGRVAVLYEGQFAGIVLPTESRDRIGRMMGGLGGGQ